MKVRVNGTGRLGKNAEVKNFENGRSVIEMSMATSETYTNKEGEKVTNTEWHDVKIFTKDPNPKFVELLAKGSLVEVSGTLEYSQAKEGNVRYAYINVSKNGMNVLDSKNKTEGEAE